MRQRLIDSLYKPLRDPHRVERTFRYFEEQCGFRDYAGLCRTRFQRRASSLQPAQLFEQGFTHLPVMSPAAAAALLGRIAGDPPERIKKDSPRLLGHRLDAQAQREVLDAVLTPELDARLTGFFDSEYLVHWMSLSVTPADPEAATVSFRWHCDKGPPNHLKLILYLNGSDEHGGNTEFVSREDTARVAECGYVFGRTRSRTHELTALSRLAGRDIVSHRRPMAAGDAVAFQPARVLHRGIVPTRAPRYAVTLCLLPSPVHWREAFRRGAMADLAVDDKWPDNATELLEALGFED